MNEAIKMPTPSEVVVIRIPADMKDEKPDDYDKVSRPMHALKRLVRAPARLIKRMMVALWQRCFGPQNKK